MSSANSSGDGDAARRYALALRRYERKLRALFADGSELAALAVEAQASLPLDPMAGHQVFANISRGNVAVTDAMAAYALAHRQSEALAKHVGLDITAYGDKFPPPDAFFTWLATEQRETA